VGLRAPLTLESPLVRPARYGLHLAADRRQRAQHSK
jgi:hypothetical protein